MIPSRPSDPRRDARKGDGRGSPAAAPRVLAWLLFPALLGLLLLLATPLGEGNTDLGLSVFLVAPAVIVYLLALPLLVRGLRDAATRRVAAFSAVAALLWVACEVTSLWLIAGPVWRANGYISDLLFFWVLPWAPAALAIGLAYWWAECHREHA